jgi:beta-lactamase regulating signal transducer with metallopeptidase domain
MIEQIGGNSLAYVLLDATVKGVLVLALAAGVSRILSRGPASVRHLVWSLALCAVLVLPALTLLVPSWSVPGLSRVAPAETPAVEAGTEQVAPRARETGSARIPPAKARAERPGRFSVAAQSIATAGGGSAGESGVATILEDEPARLSLSGWLALAWLAGALIALAGIIAGLARTWCIARRARTVTGGVLSGATAELAAECGLARPVTVLQCDGKCMPMTWGVIRPRILLPSGAATWPDALLRAVLRHELAHVRRFDYLTQLLARLACAVYWFNPLVWIAARQLRIERELACDDQVLRAGSRASDYAGFLMEIALSMRPRPLTSLATVAMARPSQLGGRLRAVLDSKRSRGSLNPRIAALFILGAALVVLPIAAAAPGQGATVSDDTGSNATVSDDTGSDDTVSSEAARGEAVSELRGAVAGTGVAERAAFAPEIVARSVRSSRTASRAAAALCDWDARGGSTSTWMEGDDDELQVKISKDDCELEIDLSGEITFSADETDIVALSSGGELEIEEKEGRSSRRIKIEADGSGNLERRWWVDGREQAYDDEARAWLGDMILVLFRRVGYQATERAERILARDGVDGLLQEISYISSDHTAGRYFAVLLSQGDLDPETVRRVVRQAGEDIQSDYELARLLIEVAENQPLDESVQIAYLEAAGSIDSDYEQRRVLSAILKRENLSPQVGRSMLQASSDISSDYELASLLVELVEAGFVTDEMTGDFFRAVGTIDSDYEMRRVIDAALKHGQPSQRFLEMALETAQEISSDYELAQLLVDVADMYPMDRQIPASYLAAAGSISSDFELSRVLAKLMERGDLSPASLAAVLELATEISSDHEMSGLLKTVARSYGLDDRTRGAFFRAADDIDSDFELAAVLSTVVTSDWVTEADVEAVLESALEISSDHEMATLLVEVAGRHSVDGRLRPAYMRAVETVDSRYQRERVMTAAFGEEA